jgi:hypothetical protein
VSLFLRPFLLGWILPCLAVALVLTVNDLMFGDQCAIYLDTSKDSPVKFRSCGLDFILASVVFLLCSIVPVVLAHASIMFFPRRAFLSVLAIALLSAMALSVMNGSARFGDKADGVFRPGDGWSIYSVSFLVAIGYWLLAGRRTALVAVR